MCAGWRGQPRSVLWLPSRRLVEKDVGSERAHQLWLFKVPACRRGRREDKRQKYGVRKRPFHCFITERFEVCVVFGLFALVGEGRFFAFLTFFFLLLTGIVSAIETVRRKHVEVQNQTCSDNSICTLANFEWNLDPSDFKLILKSPSCLFNRS